MRGWISFALALALAAVMPAAAQYGAPADDHMQTMPSATATMPSGTFTQGAFVGHQVATAELPETVTVRFDWQGTPLLATYVVRSEDHWMFQGQSVNWSQLQEGATLTIPSSARLMDVTFGGPVGVGTITRIDRVANTMIVRLPSGETRVLRFSPNAVFIREGQIMPFTQLSVNDTVLFELPPDQNMVALVQRLQPGTRATITEIGDNVLTLSFTQDGRQVTRTVSLDRGTRFFLAGQPIIAENFPAGFQSQMQVWIYGDLNNPQLVIAEPTRGFEAALIEQPEQPAVVTAPTPEMPVVTAMAAPFSQGRFVAYTPATAGMPATITMSFDWNGVPLLGTFVVTDESRWMARGQPVDFTEIQANTMVSVPQTARLANLTFGGRVGVGTISAIDRARNTVTVRLPSGETRTLRFSPQAIVLRDEQPVMVSQLNTGDTVLFEVVPERNVVGLFAPVQPGVRATITQVSEDSITLRMMQDGQVVTRTYPLGEDVRFFHRGQMITTATEAETALQSGQTVWVFGPTDQPQFIASGVTAGFETALVTPAPAVRPPAVAGVRQQPTRRVIRGRW
ncbi:MAG: hypothetical protein HY321_05485 [Armatimonadetes bacterium]|nr:hypothetical protein [Armatimonadota bacterium]